MNINFSPEGWEDFFYLKVKEPEAAERVFDLIESIRKDPFKGIGKPEPLKYTFKGFWSRRITEEHRLVYQVFGKKGIDQQCLIIQCRFHY